MRPGFSLVELSIVLVILGLLTGGILAGKSLIHAAELRSVSTGVSKYQTAVYAFRDKYFALPGDMNNATSFWGTGAACPSNTTGGTCNGDGDGWVQCAPSYTGCEMTYTSQHLALAGLIEGTYNPNWPAADPIPYGTYAYPLKLGNASLMFIRQNGSAAVFYDNFVAGNYLRIISISTTGYYTGYGDPVIPCEDAWNIDTKLDDGKPGTGRMVAARNFCTTDTTAANFASADYRVGYNGNAMLNIILP